MRITLETDDLDQEQTASVLEDVAKIIREDDDLEDRQLMDGSYHMETRHGVVFFRVEVEEDEE